MIRRFPILAQVGGLALAAFLIGQAIAISFFFVRPPPVPQIRPSEAVAALLSPAGAEKSGMHREVATAPPSGSPTKASDVLLAVSLASAVGRPLADIQVHTLDPTDQPHRFSSFKLTTPELATGSYAITKVDDLDKVPSQLLASIAAAYLAEDAPQPAFQVSMRSEGGWITVGPDTSWLSLWRGRVLLMFAVSIILLAPLTWWIARRITVPVRALSKAASSAGKSGLDMAEFPVAGPTEIAQTGAALNKMRSALASHTEERTRMLTAVAHDLRTPLTALKLRMHAVSDPAVPRMVADIDRMEHMISEIMAFSRDRQESEPAEMVELRDLVSDCIEAGAYDDFARLMPGLTVSTMASPLQLGRAIGNILENARNYAHSVEVRVGSEGDFAWIELADDGPGIPEHELSRALEPFYRGEASRNRATGGIGLGLATADLVIKRSGGALVLSNGAVRGLIARIELPI
ncbi:HAMP domain-containing protein [Luteimonas sp. XNQY3]|nr:HAMP domain-containing protein [Luteimonas sp. XNQY3]